MELKINLNNEDSSKLEKITRLLNLDISVYLNSIIKNSLSNTVYLTKEYKYDFTAKVLFYNEIVIDLTGSEKDIFEYLVKNERHVDTNELIENCVFKKKMSEFSARNKIMSIRQKTYDDLIIHRKKSGYKINKITY